MRAGLWRWILALTFVGFLLHAAACPCEVTHPHKGSTKPAIVARITRDAADILQRVATQLTGHSDAAPLPVAQLAVYHFVHSIARVALLVLPIGITTALRARGPPPVYSECPTSGAV